MLSEIFFYCCYVKKKAMTSRLKNMIRRAEAHSGRKNLSLRRHFNRKVHEALTGGNSTEVFERAYVVYYDPVKEKKTARQRLKFDTRALLTRHKTFPSAQEGSMLYTNKWTLTGSFEKGMRQGTFQVVNKEEDVTACFENDQYKDKSRCKGSKLKHTKPAETIFYRAQQTTGNRSYYVGNVLGYASWERNDAL